MYFSMALILQRHVTIENSEVVVVTAVRWMSCEEL